MANVTIDDQKLVVKLTSSEKIESLRFHDLEFNLENVTDAYTTPRPFDELSGLRVGTGIPHVICVGTWYSGKDSIFAAIHRDSDALVVSFKGEKVTKIVVTIDGAIDLVRAIRQRL